MNMVSTIDNRLSNIEHFLQRIESKMDNFMGFEDITESERKELLKIKEEMKKGDSYSYDEVFN